MFKKIIFALMLLLPAVSAATIHGTVYDFSLEPKDNVKVTIDTLPNQIFIAKDGLYSVEVPKGEYTIKAEYFKGSEFFSYAEEKISVIDDGNYVVDLILFETLEEETELLEESEEIGIDPEELEEKTSSFWILSLIIASLFVLGIIYLMLRFFKARRYDENAVEEAVDEIEDKFDDDLEKLVKILKEEKGRTTQKEIRKRLGLSEAKISLMITELEHKGVLKKIKKGRGNIVILK